jgi:hypothetical protein
MKRGLAVLIAVGLAALLAAGAIAAKKPRISTSVSLANRAPGLYTGRVSAPKFACRYQRVVRVFHDEDDNGLDDEDYEIGSSVTLISGFYSVRGAQAPAGDTIVAAVQRKSKKRFICKAAEQPAVARGR